MFVCDQRRQQQKERGDEEEALGLL